MEKMEVTSEQQLKTIAAHVLALAKNAPHERAYVVAFEGELGAGKTTLIKYIADMLGVQEVVTSPTFVIMKQYDCDEASNPTAFKKLVHIDAYRIEALDEMRVLHFNEVLAEKDSVVCIEWANKIKDLLPASTVWMHIRSNEDESRTITIS